MFSLETAKEVVRFTHNGVDYAMTRDEIDAAYDFVKREFLEEDALRQLDYFIFGYSEPFIGEDPDSAPDGEIEDLNDFERKFGISYAEAKNLKSSFVASFMSCSDCNIPENDLWHEAIYRVLDGLREEAKINGYEDSGKISQ